MTSPVLKCFLQSIQDYQLIGVVCALSVVMVIVLIIWEFVGPQALVVKELVHEVSLRIKGMYRLPVLVCASLLKKDIL